MPPRCGRRRPLGAHLTYPEKLPRLLELTCEKVEGKKVTLLVSEVLAVQLYEKASAAGGSKRPGFSFDS